MTKSYQPEHIELMITAFDIDSKTSDQLAEAYKIARQLKDRFKKSDPIIPKLNSFERKLLRAIRSKENS